MIKSKLSRLFVNLSTAVDQRVRWDRLPTPLGILVLIGLKDALRQQNLHDPVAAPLPASERLTANALVARTADGSFNDLAQPRMGAAGTHFGRNVPLDRAHPETLPDLMTPNPRTVSRELLTRDEFKPASTLNVLAAAWLQFETRDWFSHGPSEVEKPWEVPLDDGDPWPERPMRIRRTPRIDAPAGSGLPPTFANVETHWWDASQLYGSDAKFQHMLRSGTDGKLQLTAEGMLPFDPTQFPDAPGGIDGWWVGLALLHTLFMREHNAVCDRLKSEFPTWSDDDLFDHARLIVAALIAKIHTVEWTTAILGHPTLQIGMRANWWGLATERLHRLVGRISSSETVSGIPGSATDHYTAPYSMTEEFVAVYRMHPLIPDDYELRSATDGSVTRKCTLRDLAGTRTQGVLDQVPMTDLLYSFGTAYPGAITLGNYPRALQVLEKIDGSRIDLAAIDILRVRERGVPRYNEFRELLRLPRVETFEALTDDPVMARKLKEVYAGDIDKVDLMIGMYAERPPEGFGFSDTAFRIFIVMATRRLKSDRFFTTDYTPGVYTQAGLDWIADNTMSTVLLRHFPGLAPTLRGVDNAFAPWARMEG